MIEYVRMKKNQAPVEVNKTVVKPSRAFTKELAREIVKNLTALGKLTARPFQRQQPQESEPVVIPSGEYPILVDTSVFIDGRIFAIVNSGFLVATLLVSQSVLGELQHIADSADSIRRTKGRRGLEVLNALKNQKNNPGVHLKIISDTKKDAVEVDQKLVQLAKRWKCRLLTVDFNLAQVARAQGVKVMNINDLAQALKVALISGEEITVKITHEGKERQQGVGYLTDGTMVIVEDTKDRVGQYIVVVITKVHQTPAGQLFFARLK
jgi:uncharacterized protein YacL